jgi:hypothetical protein
MNLQEFQYKLEKEKKQGEPNRYRASLPALWLELDSQQWKIYLFFHSVPAGCGIHSAPIDLRLQLN